MLGLSGQRSRSQFHLMQNNLISLEVTNKSKYYYHSHSLFFILSALSAARRRHIKLKTILSCREKTYLTENYFIMPGEDIFN